MDLGGLISFSEIFKLQGNFIFLYNIIEKHRKTIVKKIAYKQTKLILKNPSKNNKCYKFIGQLP